MDRGGGGGGGRYVRARPLLPFHPSHTILSLILSSPFFSLSLFLCSVWGQDHLAAVLLAWPPAGPHDAVTDAVKSMRLFNLHGRLRAEPGGAAWARAAAALLASTPEPSFAKQNPSFEGVCMGNRKTCTCGAPFLG